MGRGPEYRIFPKAHRWPIDMWKDAQLQYSLGNSNQPQWDMTHTGHQTHFQLINDKIKRQVW